MNLMILSIVGIPPERYSACVCVCVYFTPELNPTFSGRCGTEAVKVCSPRSHTVTWSASFSALFLALSPSLYFFFNVSLLLFILSYKARKAVEVSQFVLLKKFFFVLNYIHNHFVVPSFSVIISQ